LSVSTNIPVSKKRVIFVVDGSSYIFRAYHALPPLTNKNGIPTNAVYGYTNMLIKVIEKYKPEYFVVVFDSKGPTFREHIDSSYKANRGVPPDDLTVQFPYIFEITDALNIKRISMEGFEADDIIATITDRAKKEDFGVVIVGADKDLMSTVGDSVVMLDTMKEQWITTETVLEKFGVYPSQIQDFLMLTGDSIDNIKGVQGIGNKTAKELLTKYRSLDGIYEHINDITNQRIKNALLDAKEQIYNITKPLVQLKHDVPVEIDLESFKLHTLILNDTLDGKRERLLRLLSELEFNRLIEKFSKHGLSNDEISHTDMRPVKDIDELLTNAKELCIFFTNEDICVVGDNKDYFYGDSNDSKNIVIDVLGKALSVDKDVVVHDAKTLYRACYEYSIHERARLFSVELAAYLCNPEEKNYSVSSLSLSEFGEQLPSLTSDHFIHPGTEASKVEEGLFEDSGKKVEENNNIKQTRTIHLLKYATQLKRLSDLYRQRLKQDSLEPLFYKVEMPLSNVLAKMEYTGIKVDPVYLNQLSEQFNRQLEYLKKRMQEIVIEPFNPDSPKQIANILFEKLKLPAVKKTKTGYSTDNEVLNDLKDKHPFVKYLIEYRNLAKLKNSFVDPLPSFVNQKTGRIHTHFLQTGTATGRLASSEPNLQNIPVKDEYGRMIRRAFISEKGYSILSADYSQIELRIMAHLSSDEILIDAFMHDRDIHTATAASIFGVALSDVTSQMRNMAKIVNFGIMYGISAYGLSKQLGIPQEQAQIIIDTYFNEYKGVKAFIDNILNGVRQTGFVGTILGRRRYIPKTLDNPAYQRIAINTPVQGSAADLIKLAMLKVDNIIETEKYDAKMLLQIHDELIFEVKDEQIEIFSHAIREQMEHALKLIVPLKVSISYGKTWADTKG